MDARTVLVVEADDAYRAVIRACAQLIGCELREVRSLEPALRVLEQQRVDLVVWGSAEPEAARRRQVIDEIRLRTTAPLLVVGGGPEAEEADIEAGVQQCLPRPFVPGLLVGSIRAAFKRTAGPAIPPATSVQVSGLALDGRTRTLIVGSASVSLTRREWELLLLLLDNRNRFLRAHEILRLGWQAGGRGRDQLRTYVHRLREKMASVDAPCRLLTRHGFGYCLSFDTVSGGEL